MNFRLFGKKKTRMKEEMDEGNRVIGSDENGNLVFRCEKTKLLYVLGKPQRKYVSVTQVKLNNEKE